MKEEIEKLIKRVCKKWDFYKSKEEKSKESYSDYTEVKTLNGYTTAWENPNLLWLLVNIDGGGYDGYGTQIGLTKDGRIMWEYQSHCSCNTFADSSNHGDGELCLGCDKDPKRYELNSVPAEWEKLVKVNLEEILKIK